MNRELLFNYYFGLKLSDRLDRVFISIFGTISLLFMLIILVVANLNYEQMALDSQTKIKERYKKLVSELILSKKEQAKLTAREEEQAKIFTPALKPPPKSSTKESRRLQREAIANRMVKNDEIFNSKSGAANLRGADLYADLPDLDDVDFDDENFVELSGPVVGTGGRLFATPRRSSSGYDPGELDAVLTKPLNYHIPRQGEVYIELTDELVEDANDKQIGYRDPEEIERVVYKHQDMIRHCFNKEARYQAGLSGYIKVQFSISPFGYVLPESIKILSSTLRNRQIEQCIKNYIKRWRGFSRLDESMGIATVVQKFVFN